MDSFIQQLRAVGVGESPGSFTIDPVLAFEKMRERRTLDEAFPYWKVLQALVACQASSVVVKIKKSAVTVEAFSDHEFPSLDPICGSLPANDPVLEPFSSAAISLRTEPDAQGVWVTEDITNDRLESRILHNGEYVTIDADAGRPFLPRRGRKQSSRFRLFLEHRWSAKGGLFSRLRANSKRRAAVMTALKSRCRFYPLPLLLDGRQGQGPLLDDLITEPKAYSTPLQRAAYSDHPAILDYRSTHSVDPDRFLSEPLASWYETVAEVSGSSSRLLAGKDKKRGGLRAHVLLLGAERQDGRPTVIPFAQTQPSLLDVVLKPRAQEPKVHLCLFPNPLTVFLRGNGVQGSEQYVTGQAFFAKSACYIPHRSESLGKLCVIDRGVALGLIEADLGVPGAIVVKPRGALKVDLSGGNIVQDETWDEFFQEAKDAVRESLTIGGRHIESSMTSYPFISEQLKCL